MQARGASVFEGYLDNAEATAAAFTADGWFRTGDLARLDAAGNLEITGRLKDVINRGGVKFNPADVEAIIGDACGGRAMRDRADAGPGARRARLLFRGAEARRHA